MSRVDRVLTLIENGLAGLTLAAATILAIVAVLARYFFNYIIFWSEEAVIYLIICSTFIGAVITLRHNEHVGVNVLAAVWGRAETGSWSRSAPYSLPSTVASSAFLVG